MVYPRDARPARVDDLPDELLLLCFTALPQRTARLVQLGTGSVTITSRGAVEGLCRRWRRFCLATFPAAATADLKGSPQPCFGHEWPRSTEAEGEAVAAVQEAAAALGARRLRTLTIDVSSGGVPLPAPGILAAALFPHLHRLHLGGSALLAFSSLLPQCSRLQELRLDLRQTKQPLLHLLAFHLCALPCSLQLLHLRLPEEAPLTGSLTAAVRQYVLPGVLLLQSSPQPLLALGTACELTLLQVCSVAVRSAADAAGLARALDGGQLRGCTALRLCDERHNLTAAQVIVSLPGLDRMPRLRLSRIMPWQVWSCTGLTSLLLEAPPHRGLLQLPLPVAVAAAAREEQPASASTQPAAAAAASTAEVQAAAAPKAQAATAVVEEQTSVAAEQPVAAPVGPPVPATSQQQVPATSQQQAAAGAAPAAAPAANQPAPAAAEQAAAAAVAQPAALACRRLARLAVQGFSFQSNCFPPALCCALTGLTHLALIDCFAKQEDAKHRRALPRCTCYGRQALPPEFSRLRSLRQLTISDTRLAGLEPLVSLLSLTALHLLGCDLERLPDGPYLQHLQSLDVAFNSFGQPLPFAVTAAVALRQLRFDCHAEGGDACGVDLEDWPELQAKLCSLRALETLCVELGDDEDSEAFLEVVERGVGACLVGRGRPGGRRVPAWWGGSGDVPTLSECEAEDDHEAEEEQAVAAQAVAQLPWRRRAAC